MDFLQFTEEVTRVSALLCYCPKSGAAWCFEGRANNKVVPCRVACQNPAPTTPLNADRTSYWLKGLKFDALLVM